ncbi:MAG: general secretion pathway protein GspK [PVC group bacterium]|nr:general secretion pathway protein GspK [PVC group bacterium]
MKFKTRETGSILVLVLWMLGLFTVFAVYLGISVRQRLDFLERLETRNKLLLIAEAGVKKAVSEIGNFDAQAMRVSLKTPMCNQESIFSKGVVNDGYFRVGYKYMPGDYTPDAAADDETELTMFGVNDLSGRMNINTASRSELIRLIRAVTDLEPRDADIIASSIVDWRDEDTQSLPNGAESAYYRSLSLPYNCKDRSFQALEELCYIKGINAEILPKIRSYLTVYGTGQVNINTASRSVLRALGLNKKLIRKILLFRCGEDGIATSIDDRVFINAGVLSAELSKIYALAPSEVTELNILVSQGKLSTSSEIFLIQSESALNYRKGRCQIRCVFKKDIDPDTKKAGLILSWRLRYLN